MPATKTDNMLSSLRLGVIERLALSFWVGTLPEDVDRIPLLMRPRGSEIMSRCCIYKDRAILRERLRAAMGFRLEDETDDSIPLRTYAEEALERKEPNWPILTVCDIACQGCMRARYYVTDACQGCVARSCIGSCRFGAISFSRGRSTIDPEKCRNCGMCMDACPYHAIVRLNVPCEAACPVRAIHKGNKGRAEIDFEKCTSCGRCMRACPMKLAPAKLDALARADRFEDAAKAGAMSCLECGACTYVCPAKRSLTQSCRTVKKVINTRRKHAAAKKEG